MATRQILTALLAPDRATVVSVGGVDAAKRVRAGEIFDVVVLAADALQALAKDGLVLADSIRVFARSATAVAVPAGIPHSGGCDEASLRALVSGGRRIGLSTGPSGKSMECLLQTWGTLDGGSRIIQAPPGVPVARLLARGDVDVGFQQLSELLHEPGIEIVGTVPEHLQPLTVFSCGVLRACAHRLAAQALVNTLVSADATAVKRQGGMEPL